MTQQAVAIYARISRDPEGRAEGVAVQLRRGRKYAAETWPGIPVVEYVDNDLSAADETVHRPRFEAMLTAVRRGEIGHVVCAEQSRLTRVPGQLESLWTVLALAGIDQVDCYRDGPVAVKGSRMIARIKSAVDAEEVERTRARVNDALAARAADGRPPGGTTFGYVHVLDEVGRKALEIMPEQAEAAREAARLVLAGWSLSSIAKRLTADGVCSALGGTWSTTTVRSMLTSPTITGLRRFRGQITGEGNWPPILDRSTWDRVRAALSNPATVQRSDGGSYVTTRKRRAPRRYLLTGGIAVCGRCGAGLAAAHKLARPGRNAVALYQCVTRHDGCGGLTINADPLEALVAGLVLDRLNAPEFLAALADDVGAEERARLAGELAALTARRGDLARAWSAGVITMPEWTAAREGLDLVEHGLQIELNRVPVPTIITDDPAQLATDWESMTLEERRTVIQTLVASVIVRPATPGPRKFDPSRIDIEWRA